MISRTTRAWFVAIAVLVACRAKDKPPVAPLAIPAVATAAVLAPDDGKPPPFLLLVDDAGTVTANAVATWSEVSTKDLRAGAKSAPLAFIDRTVREGFGLGQAPTKVIAGWTWKPGDIDLSEREDHATGSGQDDPPPPDEEDLPDDGEPATYIPETGKLGKHDSDRAEGQYKMRKNDDPPPRRVLAERGPRFRVPPRPDDDGPRRAAQVGGEVITDGPLDPLRALLLVPAKLKAAKVVELVTVTSAALAVSHAGKIRPLRIQFMPARSTEKLPRSWLEARVSAKGVTIEAVPDVPIEVASLDAKALAAAIDKARTTRGTEPTAPVDVLVDPEVDAQRLVDVLVALDTAGVRAIGLGLALAADELRLRGKRTPTLRFGALHAQGDLDKAIIRDVVREAKPKLLACYTTALATDATLAGTVIVQFFITPNGNLASTSATGVSSAVANCVEGAIKPLVFPKPNGGGGVQANYAFTMRP